MLTQGWRNLGAEAFAHLIVDQAEAHLGAFSGAAATDAVIEKQGVASYAAADQ